MEVPSTRVAGTVMVVLAVGCARTTETPQTASRRAPPPPSDKEQSPPETPPGPEAAERFEAVLEIDAEPGAKHFQGVWLRTDDGQRLVVDYRARPWWKPFDGRRVRVLGEHWDPKPHEQSIAAAHFRVDELELVDPAQEPMASLVALGPEREIAGRFEDYTWPEGTKLAGETMRVFVSESGTRYWLSHVPEDAPTSDEPVEAHGRTVEPSPFMARPGGAYLWIERVTALAQQQR